MKKSPGGGGGGVGKSSVPLRLVVVARDGVMALTIAAIDQND